MSAPETELSVPTGGRKRLLPASQLQDLSRPLHLPKLSAQPRETPQPPPAVVQVAVAGRGKCFVNRNEPKGIIPITLIVGFPDPISSALVRGRVMLNSSRTGGFNSAHQPALHRVQLPAQAEETLESSSKEGTKWGDCLGVPHQC